MTEQANDTVITMSSTIASKCAVSAREVQSNGKKKQVWKSNEDFTIFTLQAFMPELDSPFEIIETELGDTKEKVARVKYTDDKVQYVFEALNARIESAAKARIAAGNTPAADLDDLMTAAKGGQYMIDQATVRKAVTDYLLSKGNSEAKATAIVSLLDPRVLKKADEQSRTVIKLVIGKVTESTELPAQVVENILKACEGDAVDLTSIEL